MKTVLFLISMFFVCHTALMAQPTRIVIETKKDFQLKGDVKQVVVDSTGYTLQFTPEGYLQFRGFLKNGKLKGTTYTYDKAGHLLKESYGSHVSIYTYNARGQMIKEQSMDGAKCNSSKSFLYDAYGNARQETSKSGVITKLKNTYDTQNRLVKIERIVLPSNYHSNTTVISYLPNGWTRHSLRESSTEIITEYDNKGRERSSIMQNDYSNSSTKSITNYDEHDNLIELQGLFSTIAYSYNDQGEQISMEDISPNGNSSKTVYIYLKHDAKGNWTERIVSNLRTYKRYTETRTITYYDIPNNGDFVASAPNTVAVGGQFQLNYTIGLDKVDNFKASSLNNFNVLVGPTRSMSTSKELVNGSTVSKSSVTYTYILKAEKGGSFTIPGAVIESGGKTYTSNAVTIKVTSN